MNWQATVERTVTALGYEVVGCERSSQGLLRVFIDRLPGHAYPDDASDEIRVAANDAVNADVGDRGDMGGTPAEGIPGAGAPVAFATGPITVHDCERVTRQLQYALEVDGCDYRRLEVSSPGLDRPLRTPADFLRFADAEVDLTLKQPLQGRKKFRGTLRSAAASSDEPARYALEFHDGKDEKVLGFALDEVREARLVPVLDFKGRRQTGETVADAKQSAGSAGKPGGKPSGKAGSRKRPPAQDSGGHEQ